MVNLSALGERWGTTLAAGANSKMLAGRVAVITGAGTSRATRAAACLTVCVAAQVCGAGQRMRISLLCLRACLE